MSGLASCELTPMRQGAWPRLPHNTYTQGGAVLAVGGFGDDEDSCG